MIEINDSGFYVNVIEKSGKIPVFVDLTKEILKQE